MKHIFKRLSAILLTLCLLATMLPTVAIAETIASGTCGKNLTWTLDDAGTLTICGTGVMDTYYAGAPWSNYRDVIKQVVVEDEVTSISISVFYNCGNLESITIPDSVTTIGYCAFENCGRLVSVTIPDSVTSIGYSAFFNCSSLENITISNSITGLDYSTFYGCSSLVSVTIPDGVAIIGQGVFGNCSSLQNITIPDNVTSIGYEAFYKCSSLESITIPDSVTAIGQFAFYDCSKLTDVYYSGGKSQWDAINIGDYNTDLTSANIHYNHIHDYSPDLTTGVAATCTENGYIIYSCVCGDSYREEVLAFGHNFTEGTCTTCSELPPVILTNSEGYVIGGFLSVAEVVESAKSGDTVTLHTNAIAEDLILPPGVKLNLNGHTLTADSVLTYSSNTIIDTSEATSGLLKINDADGNMINADNAQLPVYDHNAGGYRFFTIDVIACAVTGKNTATPKIWFKIQTENFAQLYDLICTGSDFEITVKLICDGQEEETYAVADLAFTKKWADSYVANDNVYVTVTLDGLDGFTNVVVTPCIGANGVEIQASESLSIPNKSENLRYPYNVTYKEYLEMSADEQVVFYNCFEDHNDFKEWRIAAKKVYDENQIEIEIGSDGTIDLGGLTGGKQ